MFITKSRNIVFCLVDIKNNVDKQSVILFSNLNKNENDSFFLLMWLAHPAVSNVFENFSRRRLLKLCYTN